MKIVALLQLLLLGIIVSANVEKVIFLGPRTPSLKQLSASPLLHLETLSPSQLSLRRQLLARFPATPASWTLSESWILVDGLRASRSGIRSSVIERKLKTRFFQQQPTAFELSVHDPTTVFHTSTLNSSLHEFSEAQLIKGSSGGEKQSNHSLVDYSTKDTASSLLLHVSAAADYYSRNTTLMRDGLLVDLDIILDPYLLNIFPQSLVPTAAYLVVLAALSWALSSFVWQWFRLLAYSKGEDIQNQAVENLRKKRS
ncbi:hypothetical protein MMC27_001487 [Xylographa pallens]|nr:hypothetical protein [Xylographa pallens]